MQRTSVQGADAEIAEPLEIAVERLSSEGDGIGHGPDGRVVFVPATVPGDRVRVRIVESKKSFARAVVEEIVVASPDRVEPPCPVFGECGGCTWQHIAYPAQVEAKKTSLRDAMVRIGKLDASDVIASADVHPSPSAYGYRARARLLSRGGVVGFRKLRSNEPCPTPECPVLCAPLEAERQAMAREGVGDGEWEIAVGDDGKARRHDLSVRGGPPIAIHAPGTPRELRLSPGVFAQSHGALRSALGNHVIQAAGEGQRLLELYCGAGFLTLGLALQFEIVEAVESNAAAVSDLRANLAAAGVRNVRSIRDRVEHWLRRNPLPRYDTVVLDPPRSGLPKGIPERLPELHARRLVYVSCDPATLARDLRILAGSGYRLSGLSGFDLFPQTPHLEAVAVLERG